MKNTDAAALSLRIAAAGTMVIAHGLPKLLSFSERLHSFPDPLGISSEVSYLCTVGAEFFCAALVLLGLGTRLAVLPLIFTMLVAALVVHGSDPFSNKELPLLYAACFGALFFLGGGRYRIRSSALARLDRWS